MDIRRQSEQSSIPSLPPNAWSSITTKWTKTAVDMCISTASTGLKSSQLEVPTLLPPISPVIRSLWIKELIKTTQPRTLSVNTTIPKPGQIITQISTVPTPILVQTMGNSTQLTRQFVKLCGTVAGTTL